MGLFSQSKASTTNITETNIRDTRAQTAEGSIAQTGDGTLIIEGADAAAVIDGALSAYERIDANRLTLDRAAIDGAMAYANRSTAATEAVAAEAFRLARDSAGLAASASVDALQTATSAATGEAGKASTLVVLGALVLAAVAIFATRG